MAVKSVYGIMYFNTLLLPIMTTLALKRDIKLIAIYLSKDLKYETCYSFIQDRMNLSFAVRFNA